MIIDCGCSYFSTSDTDQIECKKYLPLVKTQIQSTILSTTSRTILKQTFSNLTDINIKECIYTFPLYDGVSVVSFVCHIGNEKTLHGIVKEKEQAKELYKEAIKREETAGLLEQSLEAADVFYTTLGNISPGVNVVVEITYIGELKHHETDGTRFTIPTFIAPRYGESTLASDISMNESSGIDISVDIQMPEGSPIKSITSPSHPIAVILGNNVSNKTNASEMTLSKANASLSVETTASLDKDFVLIVHSSEIGMPRALLELHPTIPNQQALLVTLAPRFKLPSILPEIVFVADRSGSMSGSSITSLVSAMKVFLKSIPLGVKFNICSFGSSHSFLWESSKSYSKQTLQQAMEHIQTFEANMGGTETYNAIKATVERRLADIPLEIMLLTDGDIWQQDILFNYLNDQVQECNGDIRVFPLGIGNGVSHSLIEGVARAGNGFAQAVQSGERMDAAVVRMVRGALSPHILNYELQLKYDDEDKEYEVIDSKYLQPSTHSEENLSPNKDNIKASMLQFSHTSDDRKDTDVGKASEYAPKISVPKYIQTPHKVPPLFNSSRMYVYILMRNESNTPPNFPTSVILRGSSIHGPLELEIPIEREMVPGETIHQLAAKHAMRELEEGRGWLANTKYSDEVISINTQSADASYKLAKLHCVRLGETFQVSGKWCSFVAVSDTTKLSQPTSGTKNMQQVPQNDNLLSSVHSIMHSNISNIIERGEKLGSLIQAPTGFAGGSFKSKKKGSSGAKQMLSRVRSLFGSSEEATIANSSAMLRKRASPVLRTWAPPSPHYVSDKSSKKMDEGLPLSSSSFAYPSPPLQSTTMQQCVPMGAANSYGGVPGGRMNMSFEQKAVPSHAIKDWSIVPKCDKVLALIDLQDFEGTWTSVESEGSCIIPEIATAVQNCPVSCEGEASLAWLTILVITYLEIQCVAEKEVWSLVVEKAKEWLNTSGVLPADLTILEVKARDIIEHI